MRVSLLLLAACSGTPRNDPPTASPTTPPTPVAPDAAIVEAAPPVPAPPPPPAATEIHTVPVAGPFPTLAAACKAARPCGFTDMDQNGKMLKPATKPWCDGVLEATYPGTLVKKVDGGELRLAPVVCEVPKGLRLEHAEHYAFIRRADGWWRSELPMLTYEINDKYCETELKPLWNVKPGRTILGIAANMNCFACGKQGHGVDTVELMLRLETGGDKPLVFAPLPVGARAKVTPSDPTDPNCKASASAVSMKETWISDDEFTLDGPPSSKAGPLATPVDFGDPKLHNPAAAGRYRFVRP